MNINDHHKNAKRIKEMIRLSASNEEGVQFDEKDFMTIEYLLKLVVKERQRRINKVKL